jgi:hypothetical protein
LLPFDTSNMTIAQIRDVTDQMAVSGKLSLKQQMALIGDGLMDPNPRDPSYQPTTQGIRVGYSRSDSGTHDFVGMMQGAASFAQDAGYPDTAEMLRGVSQAFQQYVGASLLDTRA